MLVTICLGSLAVAIATCPSVELNEIAYETITPKTSLNSFYLAQGRPYESDYSREAERERRKRDIWNHDSSSERERRYRRSGRDNDNECYNGGGRVYREPDGDRSIECGEERDIYRSHERNRRIYRVPNYRY